MYEEIKAFRGIELPLAEFETRFARVRRGSVMKTVRTVDSNGWRRDETVYFEGKVGYINRYRYEMDDRGNWIKRYSTMYLSNHPELGFTPAQIVYRAIRYFGDR